MDALRSVTVRTPARETRRILAGLVLAAILPAACAEPDCLPERTSVVSLTRLAEGTPLLARVTRGDDTRISLVTRDGGPARVGPLPKARECLLRAGLTSMSASTGSTQVRVSLHDESGEVASGGGEVTLARNDWLAVEVPLPGPLPEGGELLLATDTPSVREPAFAWGAPRLVCLGEPGPAPPSRPNVVLVSIDTLRADHLGVYGYPQGTSPHIDALAEESLIFDLAFSTSPWTVPAHASMLTGRYPEEHHAGHATILTPLAPEIPTLAERLFENGYRTIGHTGGGFVGPAYGFDRGFEEWIVRHGASFESTLPETLAALSDPDPRPFFLFLHTYEVHAPYLHPRRFSPEAAGTIDPAFHSLQRQKLHEHLELARFRNLEHLVAAYDAGVRFTDEQIGRLVDFLRVRGQLDHTLFVLTSDHGESFLERGSYISHGYTFYEEEVRVPLLVRLPGAARTGRSDELVDLTDIAGLVLDAAGVEPEAPLSGASPLARLEGRATPRRMVRGGSAYTGGVYARTRKWKVMTPVAFGGPPGLERPGALIPGFDSDEKVYRVDTDRREQENLAGRAASWPADLWELHRTTADIDRPGQGDLDQQTFGSELRQQLERLGYADRTAESPDREERNASDAAPGDALSR